MRVFILLLVLGVVEISVLVVVGQAIGVFPTIGLLLASALLGAWLLRREGRRTVREFAESARSRRPPAREISDGVLIAAGGILILIPGLVSDVCGLLCLLPPTRALLRGRLEKMAERRSREMQERMRASGYPHAGAFGAYRPGQHGPGGAGFGACVADEDIIDGEVISVDDSHDDEHSRHGSSDGGSTRSGVLPPHLSADQDPGRDGQAG